MAEVMHVGQAQHLGELLAQSDLHFVFGGIDAVFGQATGFDVTVKDDDFMPALGNFLRRKHPRRSRADHEYGRQNFTSWWRTPKKSCLTAEQVCVNLRLSVICG